MAQIVNVPNVGRVSFPDEATPEQITEAIKRDFSVETELGYLRPPRPDRRESSLSGSPATVIAPAPVRAAEALAPLEQRMAESGERIAQKESEQRRQEYEDLKSVHPLIVLGTQIARGGKVLEAGVADVEGFGASAVHGVTPEYWENIRSYAKEPEAELPIEETIQQMRGVKRFAAEAGAGSLRAAPALATSAGLAELGAPAWLASSAPMAITEKGDFDPIGAGIAAGLPGVSKFGEELVATGLSKLPVTQVVIEKLASNAGKLRGKVIQNLGGVEISNDLFRQFLEKGGGFTAANMYMAALQAPEILALPPEQREEAALDQVASNLSVSMLGFTSRRNMSRTLERMAPDILARWRATQVTPGLNGRPAPGPAEEGAPVPPGQIQPPGPGAFPPIPGDFSPGGQPSAPPAPTPAPAPPIVPPAPQPQPPAAAHPGHAIADWVRDRLSAGVDLSGEAGRIAIQSTPGLERKEAEEWAELGATEAARDIAQGTDMSNVQKFRALVSLYDRMPKLATRTTESKQNQAYSTPPPLAFAAGVLADLGGGNVVADAAAGHGMTTIASKPEAQLALNELQPGRQERLQRFIRGKQGSVVSGLDATSPEYQQVLAGTGVDRLALNPPFGSILDLEGKNKVFPVPGMKIGKGETSAIDLAIGMGALNAVKPEGKAFLIIGSETGTAHNGMGTPEQRQKAYRKGILLDLFNRFNVVDWFTVGGDLYRKMGAGWPVDVIVVHGKGRTKPSAEGGLPRPWVKAPRVIENWNDLEPLLEGKRSDEIEPTSEQPPTQKPNSQPPATPPAEPRGPAPGPTGGGSQPPSTGGRPPAGPGGGATETPRPERPAPRGGGGGTAPTPPIRPGGAAPTPTGGPGGSSPPTGGPGAGRGGGIHGEPGPGESPVPPGPSPNPPGTPRLNPPGGGPPAQPPAEGLQESLLVPYLPVSKNGDPHLMVPRNLAQAMREACLALEKEQGMFLDDYVSGKMGWSTEQLYKYLSAAQIDAAALAIRNFERGSALINTDEGGIGKGRVAALMIELARRRGMIPVFLTAKKALYTDMAGRDLPAIGNPSFVPFITDNSYYYEDAKGEGHKVSRSAKEGAEMFQGVARTGQLPKGTHGIFMTYDQIKKDVAANLRETPQQRAARKAAKRAKPDGPIMEMLRAVAPRALFVMDESHIGAGPGSEVNMRLTGLLPRVGGMYFSSATFAKRPDNLGLYALGTGMKLSGLSAEQIKDALVEGGVPMQQALSSMLAQAGELIRRQHDMAGIEWNFVDTAKVAGTTEQEIEAADTYTSFIRDLMDLAKLINRATAGMEDLENQSRPAEVKVNIEPITFAERLFNLSNQYLLALRAPSVVKTALQELQQGRKPFIALYNTMEGPIGDLKTMGLPLSFGGLLRREMKKMLHVRINDPTGDREIDLEPEDLPDGGAFFRRMEEQINGTDWGAFPISPIDFIKKGLQDAGYKVGEVTARGSQVVETGEEPVQTSREKQDTVKTFKAYNNGDLDVLIVNGCGSTGVSAHADPKFKDQRRRVMIFAQPAPDINEFMQMGWRVNRFGQTSKPKFIVLMTALAAERRFATMLRGKLVSLNANTTAEGESSMTQAENFAEDIFNQVGNDVVERVMDANEPLVEAMGYHAGDGPEEEAARWWTGKFVLLPNADAQRLWDEIINEFKDEIAQLDEAGQNPLKATVEDLRANTTENKVFVEGDGKTPFDGPAMLEKATVTPPQAPWTHDEALAQARINKSKVRERLAAWQEKSRQAEAERLSVAEQRGATDKQIQAIRDKFNQVRNAVVLAYQALGNTWGVDPTGGGLAGALAQGLGGEAPEAKPQFYGVGFDVKLRDGATSDFTSLSRQHLILATNTYKRKYTLPSSKLDTRNNILSEVDDDEAPDIFNKSAETGTERYIVTGNLLRGYTAARSATSGQELGRPRVTIYSRADGSVNTGIVMPSGWTPGEAGSQRVITQAREFADNVLNDVPMRSIPFSSVHPVTVNGRQVRVLASGRGRSLWGHPTFNEFFQSPPTQRGGMFVGTFRPERIEAFFHFLNGNGVRLVAQGGAAEGAQSARALPSDTMQSMGMYREGVGQRPGRIPIQLGGMQHVRPIEMPELVKLAQEMTQNRIRLRRFPKSRGMFKHGGGEGRLFLDPRIFRDELEAARVLSHELGHVYDWFDDRSSEARGNLIGHIHAMNLFLAQTFKKLSNETIKEELIKLSEWWRPYEQPKSEMPPTFVEYRESPEELYADALSLLFNSPGELERRAPTFYKAFWDAIDARPDAKQQLFETWELLHKGKVTVLDVRGSDIRAMFGKGDEILRQKWEARRARASSFAGWWAGFRQLFVWDYDPIAMKLPDLVPLLEEHSLNDNENALLARRFYENVLQPMEQAGITQDDLGMMLFLQRIAAGDPDAAKAAAQDEDVKAIFGRQGMANPLGMTPQTAKQQLLKWRLDHGLDQWTLAQHALNYFHELHYALARQAAAVGAYSKDALNNVITPNRKNYAAFGVVDFLEAYVPAGLRRQKGTLREIANPLTITLMKMFSMNNLIRTQRVKNALRDGLFVQHPTEIERAPTKPVGTGFGGGVVYSQPKPRDGRGILTVLEDGRPAHYYVDPYIAAAFNGWTSIEHLARVVKVADWAYRMLSYPLQITYNVGFRFLTHPIRDTRRSWLNLPAGVLPGRQGPNLIKAFLAARVPRAIARRWVASGAPGEEAAKQYLAAAAHAGAAKDPIIQEMLANFAIGVPFETFGQEKPRGDALGELLARHRILPSKEGWFWSTGTGELLKWMKFRGDVNLVLSKIAAYRLLRRAGWHPRKAAYHVRNYVGLPNRYRKAALHAVTRAIIPFYNIYVQGFRNDLQRMDPRSNSGWIFKWLMTSGLSAIFRGLIVAGVFGAAYGLRDMLRRISEYDMSTYDVIPLGKLPGGDFGWKTEFLRIPMDPAERLMSGMAYKAARLAGGENPGEWSQVFDFGMEQTPGMNSLLNIPLAWAEVARGENPQDSFRHRPVIPDREWKAGGAAVLAPMFHWSMEQSGVANFVQWNPSAETTTEFAISATPVLNRLLKASDYGMYEEQRREQEARQRLEAREFQKLPAPVQSLEIEHGRLERLGDLRNQGQQNRYTELHGWFNTIYSPAFEEIRQADQEGRGSDAKRRREELDRDSRDFARSPNRYVPGDEQPAVLPNRRRFSAFTPTIQ